MKIIRYELTVQTPQGTTHRECTVQATSINAGFVVAAAQAAATLSKDEEIVKLQFWAVDPA